jgi:hypothetical protein
MMDLLICADRGNPEPTLTQGKDTALGWQAALLRRGSRVCSGRRECATQPIGLDEIHADGAGGALAELGRYIGYWKEYAVSHGELNADTAIQEVRNAAQTLLDAVPAKKRRQDFRRRRHPKAAAT